MSTTRSPAPGTRFKAKISSTWEVIGGITSVGGPDMQTGEIDTTELDPYSASSTTPASSAYNLFKTFCAGWVNAGEIPLEANFTQAEFARIFALQTVGTETLFAIHFRNGYAFVASGFVKGLGLAAAEGDTLAKMPFSLKLTGKPVLVTHAAADAL